MDEVKRAYDEANKNLLDAAKPSDIPAEETPLYAFFLIGGLAAVTGVVFLLVIVWMVSMYYEPLGDWCETNTGCCIPGREKPQPKEENEQIEMQEYGPDANGEIHIPRAHLVDKNKILEERSQQSADRRQNDSETKEGKQKNGAKSKSKSKK